MNFLFAAWFVLEKFVNKIIDKLLDIIAERLLGKAGGEGKNTTRQSTHINAKEVKIYNFNLELVEEKLREQEERIQDLETILETEFENK